MTTNDVAPLWGPSGETVYSRTYSRKRPDGSKETWADTCRRVANGNMDLLHRDGSDWTDAQRAEAQELYEHMLDFRIIPGGRHLWATGVKNAQHLFNCWTSGWTTLTDHYRFSFLRLMEGGGVGVDYSSPHLAPFTVRANGLRLHIVCSPGHKDYALLEDAGLLSDTYDWEWDGSYAVLDSREGWADAMTDLLDTFTRPGGPVHRNRVYDVSQVRPMGAPLKTFGGYASGPVALAHAMVEMTDIMNASGNGTPLTPIEAMKLEHALAKCVVSGGVRRSARMSVLSWDDPYILGFIACKTGGDHWTTNISVAIDDAFIAALSRRDPAALRVHEAVLDGMMHNGEPGYWNRSLSQVGEVGTVYAPNPCGEILLEAFEPCNLGHVNLDRFVDAPRAGLRRAHRLVTRMLVRATFGDVGDDSSRAILDRNRRIGVGHMGVQDFLVKRGIRYSEASRSPYFRDMLVQGAAEVRDAAREYAFELRIPEPVKVTTVAPTGTIAKLAGVSEGIHPRMYRYFERRIRYTITDPAQVEQIERHRALGHAIEPAREDQSGLTMIVVIPMKDNLVEAVEARHLPPDLVETSGELSVAQQLNFQALYQEAYADNGVSFTVNLPEGTSREELDGALRGSLHRVKGTTVFPARSFEQAPYTELTRAEYDAAVGGEVADSVDEECKSGACPIR